MARTHARAHVNARTRNHTSHKTPAGVSVHTTKAVILRITSCVKKYYFNYKRK